MRAIFDNAGFVIPGEDVKIAGVKVGKIDSLDVTDGLQGRGRARASPSPATRTSGSDATCIVRPQNADRRALRGVQADAGARGRRRAAARRWSRSTDGAGQGPVPAAGRATPCQTVDIDLIGNIMREPERERLSLILNELGTGVAGRGEDLNEVIRRANPALQETDKVLEILAPPEHARSSSWRSTRTRSWRRWRASARTWRARSATPARSPRRRPSGAARSRHDIQTLPRVPRRARADDGARSARWRTRSTPVLTDLGAQAPRHQPLIVRGSGPFSQAAIPAVDSLGEAAKTGIAGGHRRAPGDRRPARAGQGRAAGRQDRCASVLESFQRHRRHRAPDGLHLLPGGRDQRLRRGRPLPARRADRQPVRDLRDRRRSRAARRTSRRRAASASTARPPARSTPSATTRCCSATAIALARALGQEVEKAKQQTRPSAEGRQGKRPSAARPSARRRRGRADGAPARRRPLRRAAAPAPTAAPAPPAAPRRRRPPPRRPTRRRRRRRADPADALLDYLFGKDGG